MAPRSDEAEAPPFGVEPCGLTSKRAAVAQIPSLTPLRGLTALFVVAFHLQFFIPNPHYEATVSAFFMGYLWVDFFFVLSGFIIAHVYGQWLEDGVRGFRYRSFLYARWTRIYPLHFAVVLAFVAFEFFQMGLQQGLGVLPGLQAFAGNHAVSGVFSQLFLVNSIGLHDKLMCNFASWSISAEFFAYLAFPVLFVALSRRSAAVSWLALSILLGLLNFLTLSNGGRLALHHGFGAVRCLLEFSIGILTYQAYRSQRMRQWLAWFSAMGLVVIVSTWTHRHIERRAEAYLRGLRWKRRSTEEREWMPLPSSR